MKKAVVVVMGMALLGASLAGAADKPRIAVLEFGHKALHASWTHAGQAAQDMFITDLVKSGRYSVIDRERLDALMREKNLSLSGDIDPSSAVQAGKLLGVEYLLFGNVTEFGTTEKKARGGWGVAFNVKKREFVAALDARLVSTTTGEIVWADTAKKEESNVNVNVMGFGGGVDDQRMFDKVLRPVVEELAASLEKKSLDTSHSVVGRVSGKIARVDGNTVWINLGSDDGVAAGDTFGVYRMGEPIRDPDTGEVLGADEEKVGSVKVTAVKGGSLALCEIVTGGGLKAGDVVK